VVAEGCYVETPLHLAFAAIGAQAFATFPRVLVVLGKGAALTLFESHRGSAGIAYQSNAVVEFLLAADAEVDHVRLDCGGEAALSLSTLAAKLSDRTRFESFNLICGPQVARHQIFTGGPGAYINLVLQGATLLRRQQHGDVTLHAIHAAPHGTSRELFKTIVDDEATGVFQGKIVVDAIAQKTDGRMHSAALMLADNAAMNNKPELEIFADDVQCGHGATVGALDADLLFYLRARGIPLKEAEALLIQSFLGEAVETVVHEGVRDGLLAMTESWLQARSV
jgi:Fe-S cluster assembly protein SufD